MSAPQQPHAIGCRMIEMTPGAWEWIIHIECPEPHVPKYAMPPGSFNVEPSHCRGEDAGSSPAPAPTLDSIASGIARAGSTRLRCNVYFEGGRCVLEGGHSGGHAVERWHLTTRHTVTFRLAEPGDKYVGDGRVWSRRMIEGE